MSRTIVEIPMQTNNINNVLGIITNTLYQDGYKENIVKGESVWSRGDGIIIKMQCFNVTFVPGKAILQAWLRDAITGESALKGFVAIVLKKRMKEHIERIENEIRYYNL